MDESCVLPNDLLFYICLHGKLAQLMEFFLLSKAVLHNFLKREVVRILLELDNNRFRASDLKPSMHSDSKRIWREKVEKGIPSWCISPIKLNNSFALKVIRLIREMCLLTDEVLDAVPEGDCLLTGGTVCQIAMDTYWPDCDVDLFVHAQNIDDVGSKKMVLGTREYDFVRKWVNYLPNVLSDFDLACCQIGVLFVRERA